MLKKQLQERDTLIVKLTKMRTKKVGQQPQSTSNKTSSE